MYSIPEFGEACRRHDQYVRWIMVAALGLSAAGILLAGSPVYDALAGWFAGWLGQPAGMLTLGVCWLVAVWGPLLPLARWVDRRMKRIPHAGCPHCHKEFTSPVLRHRVVATRCCVHCGGRVLAEPDPGSPSTALRTWGGVEDAARADDRRLARWFVGSFAAMVAIPGIGIVLGAVFGRDTFRRPFDQVFSPIWSEAAFELTAIGLGTLPGVVGLLVFLRLYRRSVRRQDVCCPHCGENLRQVAVRETGNCGRCGRQAIADPPAGAA